MTIPDYTTVVGLDDRHARQLTWTWQTWRYFKPSLLDHPMLIFFDRDEVDERWIKDVVDHPDLTTVPWPLDGVEYAGDGWDKWTNPQRHKMLSGFVHVPGMTVETPYWLKIDTDTVATGQDDWIDPIWFENEPAIVSQRWGFTRPPNQMLDLDSWVERNQETLPDWAELSPLELAPEPGASRVRHRRIISWVGFFNTEFTRRASIAAVRACGTGQIPVPSQDGYLWYAAQRLGYHVRREGFKSRGWRHQSSDGGVRRSVKEVMGHA
jgi:hypothetical protein